MSQPTVLAFHLSPEKAGRIRTLCVIQKLRFREIRGEDCAKSVGYLAGILPQPEEEGTAFDEELLVFCGLVDAQLDRFLRDYRRTGLPAIPLKAVLTPSNARWSAAQLCAELKKEHEAMGRAHSG